MEDAFRGFFSHDSAIAQAFAPGRTELAGNHVDHQGGMVLTGALSAGISARATRNGLDCLRVVTEGFKPFLVELGEIIAEKDPSPDLRGTPKALFIGVLQQLWRASKAPVEVLFGADVQVESALPVGGGLSSSASFEMMSAVLANLLFFQESFDASALAFSAQRAECDYFGKPCGRMDQTAIALGGIAHIDFADSEVPLVRVLNADFRRLGLAVVLVDLHADHAAATPLFAQIPTDMRAVAACFEADRLADVPRELFLDTLPQLRQQLGDRAVLRAFHYYNETALVQERVKALEAAETEHFLEMTRLSAASSANYLRNVEMPGASEQPALVALAFADKLLSDASRKGFVRGASRIHGGGFGGSIQVYVPLGFVDEFICAMDGFFGEGSSLVLDFSPKGAHASWIS